MSEPVKRALRAAALRMLHPLIKLLLEAGIGVGDLTALIRVGYVRAARELGRDSGGDARLPNASRIAVITGLPRAEVASILASGDEELSGSGRGRQRAERVLAGWWTDADFQNASGAPAVLPLKGAEASFTALCDRYSGDRRPAPVLAELLRVGAVQKTVDGDIKVVSRTLSTVRWDVQDIAAMGQQLGEHGATLAHNLKFPSRPRFVARVFNPRLDPRFAPMLMRDMERQAAVLTESIDNAVNDPHHTAGAKAHAGDTLKLGFVGFVFEESPETAQIDASGSKHRAASAVKRRGSKRKK